MFDWMKKPAAPAPAKPDSTGNNPANPAPAPEDNKNNQTPPSPENPMDVYSNMYDNIQKNNGSAPPAFTLDQETLDKVSGSLNFGQGIDPAKMQAALSGDAQAFSEVLNSFGRELYKTSLQHSGVLTDKFVSSRSDYDKNAIQKEVKSNLVANHFTQVPNSNHPVVKRELSRIASMLQSQYPEAPPNEIAEASRQYFMEITQAMQGEKDPAPSNPRETNWDSYFDDAASK